MHYLDQFHICDFELLTTGLEITFIKDFIEYDVNVNQVEAAKLLCDTGMIEGYRVDEYDPTQLLYVVVDVDDRSCKIEWGLFVMTTTFTKYQSKILAAEWLQNKIPTQLKSAI